MNNRLDKEKAFHDQRFGGDDERYRVSKYYSITRLSTAYYESLVLSLCRGANLVEYGCGTGSRALFWAKNGANVTAIDISDEGIKRAREQAQDAGLDVSFYQMNAENMEFDANSFDIVTGTGIIHHLNLKKAYRELSRVLRKDGHAIFIEPLGHNFIINLYRKLTPSLRTEDEQPLRMEDIEDAKEHFFNVIAEHFHILTLLSVPLRRFFFFNLLLKGLHFLDRSLITVFPFLRRYSWIVIIHLHKPRK